MKKQLPFFVALFITFNLIAQDCSDLFISEYLEGYADNKALEIYNPTDHPINLSDYTLARYRNGSTEITLPPEPLATLTFLPDIEIQPYDVAVLIVDKRDTSLWDSQFDKPVWNGYNIIDTIFDFVTGEPILDSLGNVIFGPQFDENGNALFGSETYNPKYDLQCKGDAFLNPVHDINRTFYFNGDDAVVLFKGQAPEPDGSNIVDVVGVIGENPNITIGEPAWVDENGFWLTRNSTLVRDPDVKKGRNALSDVVFALGGTFTGEGWSDHRNNTFDFMGIHVCDCDPNPPSDPTFSCVLTATTEVNTIPFKMYPNPLSDGLITIEAEENIERMEVYNMLGQMVYSQKLNFSSGTTNFHIHKVGKGMHFVNLIFKNNQRSVKKLIIE